MIIKSINLAPNIIRTAFFETYFFNNLVKYMRSFSILAKEHLIREVVNNSMVSTLKSVHQKDDLFVYILFVTMCIGFTYYAYSRKTHINRLMSENKNFQSISQFSNELLFRFNTRTKSLDFVNEDNNSLTSLQGLEEVLKDHLLYGPNEGVEVITHESKKTKHVFKIYHLVPKHDSDFILGKIVDVKDEFKEKEKLIRDSRTDGLTGLCNASYTKDTVDLLIRRRPVTRNDALLIIDLDNFKGINDSLGHYKGDKVLIDVAKSLNQVFRNASIIGRIGGDEFMVYISDVDFDEKSCHQIAEFAHKLENLDYPVNIEASVGICILENRMGYEEAFTRADISLYDIKKITKQMKMNNN